MSLDVTATVAPDARWPTTARVSVRVANAGSEPVEVARRLAVGYRDTDGRELFAEVHPRGADEVVGQVKRLYQRDDAPPEDHVPLQPGEAVDTEFDLLRWYALPGPGAYDLEVFYEGTPGDVHSSGRVPLDLPEETWGNSGPEGQVP